MSVVPLPVPWMEAAIVLALVGALTVSRFRDPLRAYRWGLAFTGIAFICTLLACLGFYLCRLEGVELEGGLQVRIWGELIFGIDELNAPLLAVVGLLHFLTALATGRTKMRRFSISWSLASEAIRLATFACTAPWVLIVLLTACTIPPYLELRNRNKPTQVYALHMGLFVVLLVGGWALVESQMVSPLLAAPLVAAILIRCGTAPAHCWVTDWFENASFGNALLFVMPLSGVYAAIRLVLPVAPDWMLQWIGIASLVTAVYASGMAVVQRACRRFFAYLFISHASLVLVGLELHTAISLTGALALWISVALALSGFGLTLRALEARFGRLTLTSYHGLYESSPALAVCFLITGLTCVGFPGTLGFVAAELVVDGAVAARPMVGVALVLVGALNGIAAVRAYFYLFTGSRHASTVSLEIGMRERLAVLTLAALLLGGGMIPQPGVASRYRAAIQILQEREARLPPTDADEAVVEHAGK
ncbi:MAG: oxidoreductase [Gemmataceae bacterium]|nr:oxidoreductase [Gemmataceae bacterium]